MLVIAQIATAVEWSINDHIFTLPMSEHVEFACKRVWKLCAASLGHLYSSSKVWLHNLLPYMVVFSQVAPAGTINFNSWNDVSTTCIWEPVLFGDGHYLKWLNEPWSKIFTYVASLRLLLKQQKNKIWNEGQVSSRLKKHQISQPIPIIYYEPFENGLELTSLLKVA